MMNNDNILNIAMFSKSTWIYPIINELNKLNDDRQEKYQNSDVREWGLSICIKLDMYNSLVREMSNESAKILKELKENPKEIDECINENIVYQFKNKDINIFLYMAYIECIIFEMKSICELILKYLIGFCKDILNTDISKRNLLKELEKKGINKEWETFLGNVRNDLIHNYAGWVSFRKENNNFELVVIMPKLQNAANKKHKEGQLERQSIEQLYQGFVKFLEITKNFLTEKIQERS